MTPFRGGCACGAIRYQVVAEPQFVVHCHCRACQKATGAHMATSVGVATAAFTLLAGTPKAHATRADSGGAVHRWFCPDCGSSLYSSAETAPGLTFLEAGSLEDASWLEPTCHIFTRSAQPWARIPEDMEQHAGMPPPGPA